MNDLRVFLDFFCGPGGAAVGYARAARALGIDLRIIGVDREPQPSYPFTFVQADALEVLDGLLHGYHGDPALPSDFSSVYAVHASPPCQKFSRARKVGTKKTKEAPDLVEPTRRRLVAAGVPYVIENVEGAPLLDPLLLCGSMFDPMLGVRRHRLFESNVLLLAPGPCRHKEQGRPVGVYHSMGDQVQGVDRATGRYVLGGRTAATVEEGREAMGIDWPVPWKSLREAIPPAYTEHIGRALLRALAVKEAV